MKQELVFEELSNRELMNISMNFVFEDNKNKSYLELKELYKDYFDDINIYWNKDELMIAVMDIEYKLKKQYSRIELLDYIDYKRMLDIYI